MTRVPSASAPWTRLAGRSGARAGAARDAPVLRAAELANAALAVSARFGIALSLAALVLPFEPDAYRLGVVTLNLALSGLGLVLVRRRFGRSVPYLLAATDALFLLGIAMLFDRVPGNLPAPYRPAIIAVWAIFPALALTAVSGLPGLLAVQAAVFAAGFGAMTLAEPAATAADPRTAHALTLVFGPGYNAARTLVILLTGAVLSVAALRARANLSEAIAASRRAADLGRYLAPTVAKIVVDTEIEALRRGRQQDMAVLFVDVRGFTAMAEAMAPREIAAFLDAFRLRVAEAIEGEGGVIDKFIGDGAMALFGLPAATAEDARRALRAGLRLLASVAGWNRERSLSGLPPVRVGIGIHHGPVFAGVLGGDRLEFTVLGDTVNVASRLEALTVEAGHDLVASAQTLAAAGVADPAAQAWRPLGPVAIRGHREAVQAWAAQPGA